jgi:TetR/AcrR family transcriptional regulator, repressor for uid operon
MAEPSLQNEYSFYIGAGAKVNDPGNVGQQTGKPFTPQCADTNRRKKRQLMPKIKPETSAARRDEILQAAETCFARQGFHQTTIQDVIKESGLSAGCIYSYFASKEDLIQAIGEYRHARDGALLVVEDGDTDPLEGLRVIARAFLGDLQKEQGLRPRRVALQLWAEALRDEVVREQVTTGIRKPIAVIVKLLRRGQGVGLVDSTIDPRAIARTMVAMFQGFVLQRLWGEPFSTAEAMDAFEVFLAGLAKRGRTPSPPVRRAR